MQNSLSGNLASWKFVTGVESPWRAAAETLRISRKRGTVLAGGSRGVRDIDVGEELGPFFVAVFLTYRYVRKRR
jgi:hypothetical protein